MDKEAGIGRKEKRRKTAVISPHFPCFSVNGKPRTYNDI